MITEFTEFQSGGVIEADICIVGGGAAGISMALELLDSQCSVVLLESGGAVFDPDIQDLYDGVNTRDDFELSTSRLRFFGGSTNHWGGWCAPLDPIDFEVRDWVPHSGWPIAYDELLPFYHRAQKYCELGRFRYEVEGWEPLAGEALPLDPSKLAHKLWQLSPPTVFGRVYQDALGAAKNLTVVLNATVTEIVTGESGSLVRAVEIADLGGRRATARARHFVLACGGIETPRLMLASNKVETAGIGNRQGLVGRYFMEHPHPDAGGVLLTGTTNALAPYEPREIAGERIIAGFGPSAAAQRSREILNCSLALNGPLHHAPSEGWDSLTKMSRAREAGEWPKNVGSHVGKVLRDLDDVLLEGYRRVTDEAVRGYQLAARTEVAPDPENRVTLLGERDALNMPRVCLSWNVSDLDRSTVATATLLLAEELGRLEVGRVRVNELLMDNGDAWSQGLSWFGHHMGTTRMHIDPKQGVVDANCQVHGLANLFVASSAVFPTSGYANPTLTIIALAVRLADELRARQKSG